MMFAIVKNEKGDVVGKYGGWTEEQILDKHSNDVNIEWTEDIEYVDSVNIDILKE